MNLPLKRAIFLVWALLGMTLASCEDTSRAGNGSLLANSRADGTGAEARTGVAGLDGFLGQSNGSSRVLGSNEFLDEGRRRNALFDITDTGEITLNLINVPLEQAAKAVLGDALKRNYTIREGVSAQVTLQTTRPLTERALLETFQTILEINGATLQVTKDLITVVPAGRGAQRVTRLGDPNAIGARIVAIPLQFIGTTEMVRLLEPIVGETVRLQSIPQRNILLVSGAREEINAAIDAVNLFDVDVLKGKSVGLFPLRAAEPEAVVEELQIIFETREGGSLQNVISFVPSTRLGAVLVVTSRSKYLRDAETWIRNLDRTAGGNQRRPVVYSLQNRGAAELAPILNEMLDNVAQEEGSETKGQLRIVADDTKNAVIVWGNDTEQRSFSKLIQSLDTVPVQVLLEATIAEVALTDELDFGLRWFFENNGNRSVFTDASSGAVGANFPGLSLVFQGSSAGVALNALSSVTDVNVVSSPSLVVLDNQEATLQIGDQVPVATQQSRDVSDPNAPVINTISFRDTGIILSVKPRVSRGGQVVLDIEQEVSSVTNTTTSGIDSPTISQRRIKTSVVVGDNQTIALGGLIEESKNRTDTGVPGASKVPVVGALFRNRSDRVKKTELLVLITPRVIRNGQESRSVTDELRQRITGADGIIQSGIGIPNAGHRITK